MPFHPEEICRSSANPDRCQTARESLFRAAFNDTPSGKPLENTTAQGDANGALAAKTAGAASAPEAIKAPGDEKATGESGELKARAKSESSAPVASLLNADSLTASQIDSKLSQLHSPLTGHGEAIRNAADKEHVSAAFLMTVAGVESSYGKFDLNHTNNPLGVDAGQTGPDRRPLLNKYADVDEGIRAAAAVIHKVQNDGPATPYKTVFEAQMRQLFHPEEKLPLSRTATTIYDQLFAKHAREINARVSSE